LQFAFTKEWQNLRVKLGLDVESPPKTWNDMKKAIEDLKKEQKARKMVRQLILFLYECTSIL
jgi:hypothetical protein